MTTVKTFKGEEIHEWPVLKWLTNNPLAGWLWLVVRIWLGWQWINSASGKITNPKWVETGEALQGYWLKAVAIPEQGRPPITFDWYRSFIQFLLDTNSYTWFAKLVVYGEVLIGIALIIGAFTGIAAFFGGFMNWNFMMAGSASSNPMLFVAAVALIVGWKVAGYIGVDYFLLRWLGTPWHVKAQQPATAPAAGD